MKVIVFRLALTFFLFLILELGSYVILSINSRPFNPTWNRSELRVRAMLMGDPDGTKYPRYLSLPYMGYVPMPGYIKHGIIQHNRDGYRGERVPVKRSSKYRILCLGGSTTYGLGVDNPNQTYPAQLHRLLDSCIKSMPSIKFRGVEVINAGLEAGTSAEELQQYLFKYRYYKPDAVVVHSGINDAELMTSTTNFQLDYTHTRRLLFHLEPLSQPARWLMHSYFFSLFTIRLFYSDFNRFGASGRECYARQQGQRYIPWSSIAIDSVIENNQYAYLPFYRNTHSLYQEVKADSAMLLILPSIINAKDKYVVDNPLYSHYCDYNFGISLTLAANLGGIVIPFNRDSIHIQDYWLDDCHLSAPGEVEKARAVLPIILQEMIRR